jgi:hypothetical protein
VLAWFDKHRSDVKPDSSTLKAAGEGGSQF